MDKRKSYQVVLEIPMLHGNKDKYTSHSEEEEIQANEKLENLQEPIKEEDSSRIDDSQNENISEELADKIVDMKANETKGNEIPELAIEGLQETSNEEALGSKRVSQQSSLNNDENKSDYLLRPARDDDHQEIRTSALSACIGDFDQCLRFSETNLLEAIQTTVKSKNDSIEKEQTDDSTQTEQETLDQKAINAPAACDRSASLPADKRDVQQKEGSNEIEPTYNAAENDEQQILEPDGHQVTIAFNESSKSNEYKKLLGIIAITILAIVMIALIVVGTSGKKKTAPLLLDENMTSATSPSTLSTTLHYAINNASTKTFETTANGTAVVKTMDNGNGIDQQEAEQEKDTHTDDNDYGDADDGGNNR